MMNIPQIFVSAASSDLRSARQTVKEALLTIDCHPVEQKNFPPDYRTVEGMLRAKIQGCQALVHLAGMRYGGEPDPQTLSQGAERRSFTQMEYDIARELDLRVYIFLLPENYPYDEPRDAEGQLLAPESQEKQALQARHRLMLEKGVDRQGKVTTVPLVFERPGNELELHSKILALQEKIFSMTQEQVSIGRGVQNVGRISFSMSVIIIALILTLMAGGYHYFSEQQAERAHDRKKTAALEEMLRGIITPQAGGKNAMNGVSSFIAPALPPGSDGIAAAASAAAAAAAAAEAMAKRYAEIEKEHGLPQGSLATMFPAFLQAKLKDAKTPTLVRAHILFYQKHYAEAEAMALKARDEELATTGDLTRVKESLRLAGRSAREMAARSEGPARARNFERARQHFQHALDIASPDADFYQWALVKVGLSMTAALEGRFEETLQQVADVQALAKDSTAYNATLEVSNRLESIGQPVWAGKVIEVILKMAPPQAAGSLDQLQLVYMQGRSRLLQRDYKGAESYFTKVLEAARSLPGKEAEVLAAGAAYVLATSINEQAEYPRAIAAARLAVGMSEKSLGAQDWQTLWCRVILAKALTGDHQEAAAKKEKEDLVRDFTRFYEDSKARAGTDDPYTIGAIAEIAALNQELRDFPATAAAYRQMHAASLKSTAADHELKELESFAMAFFFEKKYTEAEPLFQKLWERRKQLSSENSLEALGARRSVADCLFHQGKYAECEPVYLEVIEARLKVLKLEDIETAMLLRGVSNAQVPLGKFAASESSLRQALAIYRKILPPADKTTLIVTNDLAFALEKQKKYAEARALNEDVLKAAEKKNGPDAEPAFIAMLRLGALSEAAGDLKSAEEFYREYYGVRLKQSGADGSETIMAKSAVANMRLAQQKYADAEEAFRDVLERRQRLLPANHPDILWTQLALARTLQNLKKHDESERLYLAVVKARTSVLKLEDMETAGILREAANAQRDRQKYTEAAHSLQDALEILRKVKSPQDPATLDVMFDLAYVLELSKEYPKARALYKTVWAERKKASGADTEPALAALAKVGSLSEAVGDYAGAEECFREYYEASLKKSGADHPSTCWGKSALANSLHNGHKYDEAATVARDAWEQSKRLHGADSAETLWIENILAWALRQLGKTDEARVLFVDILERRTRTLQPGNLLLKESEDALQNF